MRIFLGCLALLACASVAQAQDSVRLRSLYDEALRLDPRQQQINLQAHATELRLRNIDADKKPALTIDGQAQYQSSVAKIPVSVPNVKIPLPPHDTYDAHLAAQQTLFDPTIGPRRAVERAKLAESQAETRTDLFGLRQEVTDAFFSAAVIEQRLAEIDAAIVDLSARLREMVIKFNDGAALPGDTAAVAASMLQRRQDQLQLRGDRSAALARLSELVGRTVSESEPLAVGDYSAAVATTLRAMDTLRARPEYEQFAAARNVLDKQHAVVAAQEKPKFSAFGRVGYGKPGLDPLANTFQTYWLGGLQVHWTPWTWGNTDRDKEIAEVQQQIVTTNEQAFRRGLDRGVQNAIATMSRLDSSLALDDRIVALREKIDTETRAKLREGVVTASESVDKSTDLLTARLTRVQHRVELAQARATFLTTLGVEVP